MTRYDHFTLTELAAGAWGAIASASGAAISNAAIIDLGDRTLVVDTFMTPQAAEELRAAAVELTGRDSFMVVNSHWHGDHIRGNQAFKNEEILATARTIELIRESWPTDLDAEAAGLRSLAENAGKELETAGTAKERAAARIRLGMAESVLATLPHLTLTLPSPLPEDRMLIDGAERSVEILSYGLGHTDSDAFVHLPADGLVIAGDLLWVGNHPRANDGDPRAWAGILDRITLLGAKSVLPGHGREGGKADMAEMAAYLRELDRMVAEARNRRLDEDAIMALEPPDIGRDWSSRERFYGSVKALATG